MDFLILCDHVTFNSALVIFSEMNETENEIKRTTRNKERKYESNVFPRPHIPHIEEWQFMEEWGGLRDERLLLLVMMVCVRLSMKCNIVYPNEEQCSNVSMFMRETDYTFQVQSPIKYVYALENCHGTLGLADVN